MLRDDSKTGEEKPAEVETKETSGITARSTRKVGAKGLGDILLAE